MKDFPTTTTTRSRRRRTRTPSTFSAAFAAKNWPEPSVKNLRRAAVVYFTVQGDI